MIGLPRRKLSKGSQLVRTLNNEELIQISIVVEILSGHRFHGVYSYLAIKENILWNICWSDYKNKMTIV